MKNAILDAINSDTLMDFISSKYYLLDKYDMSVIIKELQYALYSGVSEREYSEIMEEFQTALIEEL